MKTKKNPAMADRVLELAQQYGVLHARDLQPHRVLSGVGEQELAQRDVRGAHGVRRRGLDGQQQWSRHAS